MRVHEYLRILVIDTKIVDYEYFMDDITDWEIAMLMNMSYESHRTEWETARYIAYHNAIMSGNLKKQYADKPMTDILPLPYDEDRKEHDIEISNSEVSIMTAKANKMSELFKNKIKKGKKVNG